MPNNQSFIARTNFLKNDKNINFSKQAEKLRVERHIFDSYRANRVAVPAHVEKRLITEYPELTEYAQAKEETWLVEDVEQGYSFGAINVELKDLAKTQAKLIDMMEGELEKMRIENRKLREKIRNLQQG